MLARFAIFKGLPKLLLLSRARSFSRGAEFKGIEAGIAGPARSFAVRNPYSSNVP
jgi:hypothetical protein